MGLFLWGKGKTDQSDASQAGEQERRNDSLRRITFLLRIFEELLTMRWRPWFVRRVGVLLSMVVVLAGCTYDAAIQRLSPAEQAEFVLYRHVMTASQVHTYVAQPTAAARTTYLQTSGLVQRFQALEPLDQEAIRSGLPRVGISVD